MPNFWWLDSTSFHKIQKLLWNMLIFGTKIFVNLYPFFGNVITHTSTTTRWSYWLIGGITGATGGYLRNYDGVHQSSQCYPFCWLIDKSLKVSKFQKHFFLFSFEPKNQRNYFLNSALASNKSQTKKMKALYYIN